MTISLFPELEDASTKIFIGYTGAAVTNLGHTFSIVFHLFLSLNTLSFAKQFHQSVFTYLHFKRSYPQVTMFPAYFLNKTFLVFLAVFIVIEPAVCFIDHWYGSRESFHGPEVITIN